MPPPPVLLRTSTYGQLHGRLLDLLQFFIADADALGVARQAVEVEGDPAGAAVPASPSRSCRSLRHGDRRDSQGCSPSRTARSWRPWGCGWSARCRFRWTRWTACPATGSPSPAATLTWVSIASDHRSMRSALAGVLRAWRNLQRASLTFGMDGSVCAFTRRLLARVVALLPLPDTGIVRIFATALKKRRILASG